jgi:hypothetical protein
MRLFRKTAPPAPAAARLAVPPPPPPITYLTRDEVEAKVRAALAEEGWEFDLLVVPEPRRGATRTAMPSTTTPRPERSAASTCHHTCQGSRYPVPVSGLVVRRLELVSLVTVESVTHYGPQDGVSTGSGERSHVPGEIGRRIR